MRKALINGGLKDDSPLVNFFKLDTKIYTSLNKKASEKIENELTNQDISNINYVEMSHNIITKLVTDIEAERIDKNANPSNKNRELAYQKLIALAIATGRRQIEIMKLLEISKKKNEAVYKNLAKKKNSDKDSVIAPILIDINLAKKWLRDVKIEFKTADMSNKEVNSKYNGSVKKSLSRYLPTDIAAKGFHFLRAVYAETCYQKFGKNIDKNIYFQEILGHELKLNAGHSYQAKTK